MKPTINHTGHRSPHFVGKYAGFGVKPPHEVRIWWGARGMLKRTGFELFWDTQQMVGNTESERKAFAKWIQHAVQCLRHLKPLKPYDDRELVFEDKRRGYRIVATSRSSYSYVSIGAWSTGD